ncbi:MAG: FtsX-like permease family protein, partial [Peptostreptococcaceae bacterium]|nr:FtsX-like permease family protein [Peptostreptococcaceae bacterium]
EFASLLVMGMSEKEVIGIVKLEQWLITMIAIPLGIPLTSAMVQAIGVASSNDMFSLDFEVDHISFIIGGSITLIIIALAQFSASQKIQNLKLSDALKADE